MAQMLAKVLRYPENPPRESERLRGAQHWACRRKLFQRPDLGKIGNVGSPEGFTASLRVEVGEQSKAELWTSFGGQRCRVERARAHQSELTTASPLRPSFLRGEARGREWTRPGARGRRRGGHARLQR